MTESNVFPSIDKLVPHDAPMILIDNVIDIDETTVHCQVFISERSQFFDSETDTVAAWVGIEYMAQSVSAWSGYQSFLKNEPSPIGFLLGTRRYNTELDRFLDGDVLDIYAEKLMENDGMGAFSCSIQRKEKILATAQLNVFVPNNEQLEEMLKGKNND